MEKKLIELIEPKAIEMGFEIVKLSFGGGNTKILQILIDKLGDQAVTARDCQLLSREISVLLDVENIINDKFMLEVSSAGLERPLTKLKDYEKFIGRDVKLQLYEAIENDDVKKYKGKIVKIEEDNIYIQCDERELQFKFANIKKANLVITDEMFKNMLNKK